MSMVNNQLFFGTRYPIDTFFSQIKALRAMNKASRLRRWSAGKRQPQVGNEQFMRSD